MGFGLATAQAERLWRPCIRCKWSACGSRRRGGARSRTLADDVLGIPFREVEAPDSAIQELEELAALAAGPNWSMEFARTALHFRFQHKQSGGKFIRACRTRKYPVFIAGTRRYLGR
jgi:hypothetical protein